MAIKKTLYPHTGIYQRKISKVALRASKETSRDLTKLLQGGHQDDPLGLNAMESEASECIKTYFKTEMGGSNETFRPESIGWLVQEYVDQQREKLAAELRDDLSQEKRRERLRKLGKTERAGEACEIIDLIDGVRLRLRTKPSHQTAIETGFLLGTIHERFRARQYESSALTGSKTLTGASAGGYASKKTALERYRQIARLFNRSGLSQREIEKRFAVPRKTLQRALKAVGPSPAN